MRGDDVVVFVYAATILGLMLAFLAGRYTKYSYLRKVFLDLRLTKASELLEKVQPLSRQQRLALLRELRGDLRLDERGGRWRHPDGCGP